MPNSPYGLAERTRWLIDAFPGAMTDGRFDPEKLRSILGEGAETGPERYTFGWFGRSDALRLLQKPSRATLVPAERDSVRFAETSNVLIEGENLESLKLLYKAYFGRVKVIYIDPPYNRRGDKVYRDDYSDPLAPYLRMTGQVDAEGNVTTSKVETGGRIHSGWLSMIYPRLFLARQLLREDGVIFVSIDDNEVHNLRMAMNEVFGEENFIAQITVLNNPKGRVLGQHFAVCHDYLLVYSRFTLPEELGVAKTAEEIEKQYPEREGKRRYRLLELRNTHRQFNKDTRPNLYYPLFVNPATGAVHVEPAKGLLKVLPHWEDGFEGCWTWQKSRASRDSAILVAAEVKEKWKVFRKAYADDEEGDAVEKKLKTIWTDRQFHTEVGQAELEELIPGRIFDSPKPVGLLKTILRTATSAQEGDIVLDFFAGSGTTGQAVLDLNREDGGNRRFVLVQLPEPTEEASNARRAGFKTIADICRRRVHEVVARMSKGKKPAKGDASPDLGFRVFRLTPSNFRVWEGTPADDPDKYAETLALFVDPWIEGASEENVLWEITLREGLPLDALVARLTAGSKRSGCYDVRAGDGSQRVLIALDKELKDAVVRAWSLAEGDTFVCRDSALTDELAANLALQCRLKTV